MSSQVDFYKWFAEHNKALFHYWAEQFYVNLEADRHYAFGIPPFIAMHLLYHHTDGAKGKEIPERFKINAVKEWWDAELAAGRTPHIIPPSPINSYVKREMKEGLKQAAKNTATTAGKGILQLILHALFRAR